MVFRTMSKWHSIKVIKLIESILSIVLALWQFKQFKRENKHAANMIQNCFYLQAPQSFPPNTNLVPDFTM